MKKWLDSENLPSGVAAAIGWIVMVVTISHIESRWLSFAVGFGCTMGGIVLLLDWLWKKRRSRIKKRDQ